MEHANLQSTALSSAMRWMLSSVRGRGDEVYRNDPGGYEAVARVLLGRGEVAESVRDVVDRFGGSEKKLVVDAACGTGLVTDALAGSGERVVGTDASPAALAFARASKHPSLEFREGDLHDFSAFAPGSIDMFSLCFASRYIRDAERFYRELARFLSKDGIAVITSVGHAKTLARVQGHAGDVGLLTDVIRPRFRSLFNRMHGTAHVVLSRGPCG